ncbi:flagellar assembly protein FliH [Marmoricola sp. OAE513]|uniref:FliH/SctL family protein n=1 Tax=Marmoricola sp. OAE513 TaxID=2817894 RepID=UPI001AE4F044
MNSSSEAAVVPLPELRTGEWTRLGSGAVLGDAITEATLTSLAESTRLAASAQGYSVGWAEGQRAARSAAADEAALTREAHDRAEARRSAEHAAAVAALEDAAAQLRAAVTEVCARVEDQASELAWELTRELVGHELAGPGIDVVRRVLALDPTAPITRVRLHPDDLVAAGDAATALRDSGAVVVGDPSLQRGDALVEADEHVLDLRLDQALERVREVLR